MQTDETGLAYVLHKSGKVAKCRPFCLKRIAGCNAIGLLFFQSG